jgi:enoyl-CoA hydratase/carnithine racemase/3-hydroxyacyl-CoA dehydrogenase
MATVLRESTLQTLGLGNVIEIFRRGQLPAETSDLVDRVFGNSGKRGALVISGANGIVGAGKTMQLGSRLQQFDIPIVALDFPAAPDGISKQYPGLVRAFGPERANRIMTNVIRLHYDGRELARDLKRLRPAFLLEAIPEILDVKRAHYAVFRQSFPDIEIRSVTSGFPSSELGVRIAHPAFPHEINKLWETVEPEPSAITQLLWSTGLIPVPVSDNWSFILDVLFCGITLAALQYHHASNMPVWKIDKYVRKLVGPNPLRAHDAIGAAGANFLTWSCLHHLSQRYGDVFKPTEELVRQKENGQNWYPLNHFRPLVDWTLEADEMDEFRIWILGPLFQMTSLMLHERRGHLTHMNAIGELCAQFRRGVVAMARALGPDTVVNIVEAYHQLHREAADDSWYPDAYAEMDTPDWQQLYVNAEHDGNVGVITVNRESYNSDVDAELNRAISWLNDQGVDRVIVTGDFHLSTQLVGADTSEFYPALDDTDAGARVSAEWSRTARRLNDDFEVSVGLVNGKRCLGGMLELLMHCHYLVAVEGAELGMPEVTLPVVPGMEGCHWMFRKSRSEHWSKVLYLLLSGTTVKAEKTLGWLIDYAGPLGETLIAAWRIATGGDHGLQQRPLVDGILTGVPSEVTGLSATDGELGEAARKAIIDAVQQSCGATVADALAIQTRHSAEFMTSKACRKGRIGTEFQKTMGV